jgi:hypothetical protein
VPVPDLPLVDDHEYEEKIGHGHGHVYVYVEVLEALYDVQ